MNGIKVKIKTIDQNNKEVAVEGYICRRLNADLYEIWSEELQTFLWLEKDEFKEVDS
jgi:hypothetical protein